MTSQKPSDLYFLFVFTDFEQKFTESILNHIFEVSWHKALLNVNILIPYGNDSMLMTTYVPFKHGCNTLNRYDLAVLTAESHHLNQKFEEIYPEKAGDLSNCSVIVATFPSEPFVIVKEETEGDTIKIDGIDAWMLRQLGYNLNYTPIFVRPPDRQKRGRIYPNRTVSGSMGMIARGTANLTVGAYVYNEERNEWFTPSDPYVQVLLGFAYANRNDVETALQKMLSPFDTTLWISVTLSLLGASVVISLTKQMDQQQRHFIIGGRLNRTPILNMFNSFLGGSIGNPQMAKSRRYFGTFARTLAMIWFLVTLVVRGSYQGALFDSLKRQKLLSPYETIEKIFASNCKLLIMSTAATSLDSYAVDKSRYILYKYNQKIAFRQIYDRDVDGVVYANHMQVNYFNLVNSPNRTAHFTKNRLILMPVVIYFPKNTVLRRVFNDQLLKCTEAGLIEYWTRKFNDIRSSLSSRYDQRVPVELKPKNIAGIMEICCALTIFSTIVLLMEILSNRFLTLKRFIDFFSY